MKNNIIINTDPGVDDAIALMYAFTLDDKLNINLITSAGGNIPIESITENALFLVEFLGKDIPVAQGYPTPLKRKSVYTSAHGKNGLGKYNFNRKKLKYKPVNGEACDVMYEKLKENKEKTTIISLGPMTNIARLFEKYPDSKNYVKEVVFESGTKEKIYGKPYKSFNTGYDPEATEIVFKSGVNLVMIPMELGHIAYLDKEDIKLFKHTNNTGKVFEKMFKGYNDYHVGKLGAAVHDVCVVYYLVHPEYFKSEKAYIEVKYYKSETEEFGYIDTDYDKKPNATICVDLDINMFKYDLFEALKKYK